MPSPPLSARSIFSAPLAGLALTVLALLPEPAGAAGGPTLYSFCARHNCPDGATPVANLLADAHGDLFGTTAGGGANNLGTVFEIKRTSLGFALPTDLVKFRGTNGSVPEAGLIADKQGDLFGTTAGGGTNNMGTVFEIKKTSLGFAAAPTVLVDFDGADGATPQADLIADAHGNLFGTTAGGGTHFAGTVFEIRKKSHGFATVPTVLYSFCAQASCIDGDKPAAGLIADADGNLFGTTALGGTNNWGTVFEIAKTSLGFAAAPTVLYSFCAQTSCTDGAEPMADLIADADGNLFGTTISGGASNQGTVFEIAKTADGFAAAPVILYSFCAQTTCTDGSQPAAGLIADPHGDLFGTTVDGGAHSNGTVFEMVKESVGFSAPNILNSFCARPACADGSNPRARLIADPHGDLFGTTPNGGTHHLGTVFEIPGP